MTADKKTLVLLLPGFPKDENDSACLPFQQAFARCAKRNYPGINVIVLTLQYPYKEGDYFIGSLPVYSFGGQNKSGLSKLFLRRKTARKLEEIWRTDGIVAIISFWFGECALAGHRFAIKHPQVKHFCWLMGQDAKPGNSFVRKIKPSATQIVALSDFLQDEFERNYRVRPANVITPGVNMDVYGKTVSTRDIDLLAAGSLITLKRFELFIEVVSAVRNEFPQVKAVLIGKGPEKKNLQRLIHQHKMEDNITLAGELPHAVVLQMMQRTKVFLHTSAYEGFGIVCLEAIYGGAAVISLTQPLKKEIAGWQTVPTKEEMATKAIALLKESQPVPAPGHMYSIENCAEKFMLLADLAGE